MRILPSFEFSSTAERTQESRKDYIKRLASRSSGAQLLGTGGSAYVFSHPTKPGRILRVSSVRDGGVRWLQKCFTTFKNNPWVPVVYDIRRFVYSGKYNETYIVVECEVLKKASKDTIVGSPLKVCILGPNSYTGQKQALKSITEPKPLALVCTWIAKQMPDTRKTSNYMLRGKQLVITDPIW